MQLPTHPRRSDCPGRFLSAEPLRTSRTSSKAMYNQPNSFYLPKASDDTSSFWIEPRQFATPGNPASCNWLPYELSWFSGAGAAPPPDRIYRLEVPTCV